ncbi:hypothetical protein [uncultured Adlercreutzia sp.]|uniref:hypothetical protein n=1 Tax=uncultured Adlercreutzia sp. TaxID=875803 RepID=UPI0026F395E3|nr:hypothetical protein [uncultured Adlercreutzia sp.]
MSSIDLALRYLIIAVAWHLACAWVQTFQSPYPIVDALELAGTAEEQLFKSLGISWRNLSAAVSKVLLISVLAIQHCSRSAGCPSSDRTHRVAYSWRKQHVRYASIRKRLAVL